MCRKEETTLKRSNRSRNGHCHGSTAFGVVGFCGGAAGDASRHAAVICCGDGFTVRPADVERYNRIMGAGDVSKFDSFTVETWRAAFLLCQFGNFDTPTSFSASRCHPCAHVVVGADRHVRPVDCTTGMDARPDADERRSRSTNANRCVVQNAPPAEMERKEETTLKRSNGHWQDSTAFGVVVFCGGAAGDASRHTAVICCGGCCKTAPT